MFLTSIFQVVVLPRCPPHCLQRPGGLAKLGLDCTPFGLSLTVKGHSEVRIITLPPNFAKPLVMCWHFLSVLFLCRDYVQFSRHCQVSKLLAYLLR